SDPARSLALVPRSRRVRADAVVGADAPGCGHAVPRAGTVAGDRARRRDQPSGVRVQPIWGLASRRARSAPADCLARGLYRALREDRLVYVDRRAGPNGKRDRVGRSRVDLDTVIAALKVKGRVKDAYRLVGLSERDESGDSDTHNAHSELLE